jgi:hypothetical protein
MAVRGHGGGKAGGTLVRASVSGEGYGHPCRFLKRHQRFLDRHQRMRSLRHHSRREPTLDSTRAWQSVLPLLGDSIPPSGATELWAAVAPDARLDRSGGERHTLPTWVSDRQGSPILPGGPRRDLRRSRVGLGDCGGTWRVPRSTASLRDHRRYWNGIPRGCAVPLASCSTASRTTCPYESPARAQAEAHLDDLGGEGRASRAVRGPA